MTAERNPWFEDFGRAAYFGVGVWTGARPSQVWSPWVDGILAFVLAVFLFRVFRKLQSISSHSGKGSKT